MEQFYGNKKHLVNFLFHNTKNILKINTKRTMLDNSLGEAELDKTTLFIY